MTIPLLEGIAPPRRLVADKAYGAEKLRNWLKVQKIRAVIPLDATGNKPYPLDRTPWVITYLPVWEMWYLWSLVGSAVFVSFAGKSASELEINCIDSERFKARRGLMKS